MFRPIILSLSLSLVPLAAPGPVSAQSREAQVMVPDTALAETAPELRAALADFGLYDVLQIMSVEGIAAAADMETDMFPGRGGSAWPAVVAGIYATDRLIEDFEAALPLEGFTPEIVADLQDFASSDLGQRIVAGEVETRRAFIEPEVEEAANQIAADALQAGDPRLDLLRTFIEANDLIDRNVSGALNANFAFFRGLADGDGLQVEMPEDLMLAEVWGQEPEIRADTMEWLLSYQLAAYAGLSDADMEAYIAFSQSDAGRAFNRGLFVAFDAMFERVSYDLGRAAAVFIAGEDT
jgi:hypothetical protein